MSQPDRINSTHSELETVRRLNSQPPTNTEHHRNWPSLSSFMALLSGSRANQDNEQIKQENETIDEELSCPICQDIMNEVFSTNCGHSYCYQCITLHIKRQTTCPLCRSGLTRAEIYPNFQLNKLAQHRIKILKKNADLNQINPVERIIKDSNGDYISMAKSLSTHLPYKDLVEILKIAMEERKNSEDNHSKVKDSILRHFLACLKQENKLTIDTLLIENDSVEKDYTLLENKQQKQINVPAIRKRRYSEIADTDDDEDTNDCQQSTTSQSDEPFVNCFGEKFDDLKILYRTELVKDVNLDKRRKLLDKFSTTLYELTKYSQFDIVDSLNYTENNVGSSIVSSLEFDRDQEFFAVGGVTKQIKIFDFNMIGHKRYSSTIHCPVRSMTCLNKISCLAWSPYIKSQIASSDYHGIIDLWDTSTGQKTQQFEEHKRRAWSVDICTENPNILASGSDDTTVKVWSLSQKTSIHTLEQKGNVCCAKFAPNNSHYLAVGSADHEVSCYDLRFPNEPVKIYEGHKKAVSYVKWLNDEEIVSASIDSTLKLWDRESTDCKRTFDGHQNEKNFVGLSVNGDWISCGSETNTLYTYHKSSHYPVATFKFPPSSVDETDIDEIKEDDPPIFVSSVCWKKGTAKILAANSKGVIKVLEMKE